jgi:hypothetical protein
MEINDHAANYGQATDSPECLPKKNDKAASDG